MFIISIVLLFLLLLLMADLSDGDSCSLAQRNGTACTTLGYRILSKMFIAD